MFIKLTRLDNTPIWINAAFVVTVEPRKGGGSVVVPIGDGLDYDVRETTDKVLEMLVGAPVAAVVPVPPPKSLTPTPADVSPETGSTAPAAEASAAEPPADKASETADSGAAPEADEAAAVKRTVRSRSRKAAAGEVEPKPAVRKPRAKAAKKVPVEFPDEQVERLRKMAPGSLRKLQNTLAAQFKVAEAEAVVAALQARGVVEVDLQGHVVWK